jgi:hypothetical protein
MHSEGQALSEISYRDSKGARKRFFYGGSCKKCILRPASFLVDVNKHPVEVN